MEFDEEVIDLAFKNSSNKELDGLTDWIGKYKIDPSIIKVKETKNSEID